MRQKPIIYQTFPRILTNENSACIRFGTLEQNGSGKMNDYTPVLLKSLRDMGITAVWYTGIIEHATKSDFTRFGISLDNPHIVKGEAGSPYAIKDYYDVDPAIAVDVDRRMEEFEALVKRTHAADLQVIVDFVPNHTARVYHSDSASTRTDDFGENDDKSLRFSPHNNYYYIPGRSFSPSFSIGDGTTAYRESPAKATGNDCFTEHCDATDWYETAKLNYGHDYSNGSEHFDPIPDTWRKMLDILLFWASKGVDGFRCDMVFMVPQAFWHWVIPQVKKRHPSVIFIGEIYDTALYRQFLDYCRFDYLYDKVNLYDTLMAIEKSEIPAENIIGCWQAVDNIGDRMVNFLENHDEVRFASDEYAKDPMRVIPSLVVSSMISKGPFILYYGQELGIRGEEDEGFAGPNHRTTIFDYWSYDEMRRWHAGGKCTIDNLSRQEQWLRMTYSRLLNLCNERKEIREGGFFDLTYANTGNPHFNTARQYAFVRYSGSDILLIVANFDHSDVYCRLKVPSRLFETLKIQEGIVEATDLYNGEIRLIDFCAGKTIDVSIGASNAAILSFSCRKTRKNNKN